MENELARLGGRPSHEARIEQQLDRILDALDRIEALLNAMQGRQEKTKPWASLLLRGKSKRGGADAKQSAADR